MMAQSCYEGAFNGGNSTSKQGGSYHDAGELHKKSPKLSKVNRISSNPIDNDPNFLRDRLRVNKFYHKFYNPNLISANSKTHI